MINYKKVHEFTSYEVNTIGEIFSNGKKLNPCKYKTGYIVVKLFKNGNYKRIGLHRLIAESFIPNPLNKPQVNHINGIKTDNRVENLEWVTPHENHIHAKTTGLKAKGESHGISVLDKKSVLEIKQMLKEKIPQRKIAKIYGVCQATIKDISIGKTWVHV